MRVRWATTCERIEVDDRGAHSLQAVGVSILFVHPSVAATEIPVFVCLSVPRHELDTDLSVGILVTDPSLAPVAEVAHTVRIPAGPLPSGAMDGYEVPAYLSSVVEFPVTGEGAYSIFVTTPPPPGVESVPPEPLTIFVQRP